MARSSLTQRASTVAAIWCEAHGLSRIAPYFLPGALGILEGGGLPRPGTLMLPATMQAALCNIVATPLQHLGR